MKRETREAILSVGGDLSAYIRHFLHPNAEMRSGDRKILAELCRRWDAAVSRYRAETVASKRPKGVKK